MMIGDVEAAAQLAYSDAGFSSSKQAPPIALAERLLGEGSVRLVPRHALPGDGAVARVGDRWGIYVVEQAPDAVRRFIVLHELSHVLLGRGASEQDCNSLAAALLMPRDAFLAALKDHGTRLPRLARSFGATESCVGLRFGEVTERPTALVSPSAVKIRGAAYLWPNEASLRALAESPKTPGLKRARLRDDTTRAVLRAV
jgi:hypothetical protein